MRTCTLLRIRAALPALSPRPAIWLGLALVLGACTVLEADPTSFRHAELSAARARWAQTGAVDYRYTVRHLSYALGGVRAQVTVRGGATESVVTDPPLGTGPAAFAGLDTMDEVFETIARGIDADPDGFAARYDPVTGVPLLVTVDPSSGTMDEEWGVEISHFSTPLPGSNPATTE